MHTLLKQIKRKVRSAFCPPVQHEVYTAMITSADELLGGIRTIVAAGHGPDQLRLELLKDLEFTSCDNIANWQQQHYDLLEQAQLLPTVRYYASKYPGYPFILFDHFDQICAKFGYMCLPVTSFRGNVPETVVDELARFDPDTGDQWMSDYPTNIIEFQTSGKAVRRPVSELSKLIPSGSQPNVYRDESGRSLKRLPRYICLPRDWHQGRSEPWENYEFIVLHPVPDGFLILSHWVIGEK